MSTTLINKKVTDTQNETSPQSLLRRLWANKWVGAAVAGGIGAVTGIGIALTLPRGPVTSAQALITMGMGLLVGFFAGFVSRSRWAMLVAPVAHVVAIEITRLDLVGPTVDAIRLDNSYGILALILGRGFHGLVALLPMILAVSLGIGAARRLSGAVTGAPSAGSRWGNMARRAPAVILWVALAALAVAIAWPASTPPIIGADGEPLPGSVAELTTVELGGQEQGIMIRGASVDNPVLLYLSGGPGQSDLGYARVLLGDLEQDFIVVTWDQRGTGTSYRALEPTATLTLDQAVADTVALTNYLRERFGEEKIYLLGESWGTTLGVLAVQQAPELFHAWIGSGQMVSQRETDRRLYADMLALAERNDDVALKEQMLAYGEPPYADIPFANATVMAYYDALGEPYTPPQAYVQRGEGSGVGPWGLLASEYSLVNKVNALRGLIDMFTIMYPQLQEIDFRRDVPRLDVPVYIMDGKAELAARRDLGLEWYEQLDAPIKRIYTFENAGHAVAFEQFEALHQIMVETVLPETYSTR